MRKLSVVRLGSYAVVIAVTILLQRRTGVIPVHLLGGDQLEACIAMQQSRRAERMIVSSIGFQNSKLSGSAVITIAEKQVRDAGQSMDKFLSPKITLRVIDGALVWIVSYETKGDWRSQFDVKIEDSTGEASYTVTPAVM